jgi:hypothetical protein
MFLSYDHLQAEIYLDGIYYIYNILYGNPEPDVVHATGCKQPTLRARLCHTPNFGLISRIEKWAELAFMYH